MSTSAGKNPSARIIPQIPPVGEQMRVVIDTDAKNEIDDQYAISLAILSPERFRIEGFVGANFDNERGGPGSVHKSVEEIHTVLDKAGLAGKWPVLHGSDPMRYQAEPVESEGVDFIIDRAMASTQEDPLWVIGIGAATDMASALLKEPAIVDRVRVLWHFRTQWPEKCINFNVFGDVRAARVLFHTPVPFVLGDTGGHLTATMEETENRLRPFGELGKYLHDFRHTHPSFSKSDKGFFDLADIAALVAPEIASWETVDCPEVHWDLTYQFTGKKGQILRLSDIDRDAAFELLYERVQKRSRGAFSGTIFPPR